MTNIGRKNMVTIFTIGDSLTAGYPGNDPKINSNPKSSYQYWLEKEIKGHQNFKNSKVFNFGVPGITSKEILDRLIHLSKEKSYIDANIVILNGGGNEWQANERIDDTNLLNNLSECCNYCLKDGKKVILSSITPFGDHIVMEQLEEIAGKLASFVINKGSKDIIFFDWFKTVFDQSKRKVKEEYDSGDNEHLNVEGYKVIGIKLAELLVEKNII